MVPCKSTAEEVSFEWLHDRISFTNSKVRTTLVYMSTLLTKRAKGLNHRVNVLGVNNKHYLD